MSNNYFQFKEFVVYQDKTAMKVGVDGVLLGSWVNAKGVVSVLDVGTGTGLLSLMLAQKSNAHITAIEIEENAYIQAQENVKKSKWSEQITVNHCSFQEFINKQPDKFDLIICNPPYFTKSLNSKNEQRSVARHDTSLPLDELFKGTQMLLTEAGGFYVIYPYEKKEVVIKEAARNGLYLNEILYVKGTEKKDPNRFIGKFSFTNSDCKESAIIVRDSRTNDYTKGYKELTKDYYLAF